MEGNGAKSKNIQELVLKKKEKKAKKGEMESAVSGKKGFFRKRMDLFVPLSWC